MSYTSHADLGGTIGHGRVVDEPEAIRFHHPWEARALALTIAAGAQGRWNIDMSRSARETLPDYAELTYYEIWIAALERLLVETGLVGADELAAGTSLRPPPADARPPLAAERVEEAMRRGGPADRPTTAPARFGLGDRVRLSSERPEHHTRLPGYLRGAVGTVVCVHGMHVFPDAHAHGRGEQPQWLYTVEVAAADVWDDGRPGDTISVDAWEPYLAPADGSEAT